MLFLKQFQNYFNVSLEKKYSHHSRKIRTSQSKHSIKPVSPLNYIFYLSYIIFSVITTKIARIFNTIKFLVNVLCMYIFYNKIHFSVGNVRDFIYIHRCGINRHLINVNYVQQNYIFKCSLTNNFNCNWQYCQNINSSIDRISKWFIKYLKIHILTLHNSSFISTRLQLTYIVNLFVTVFCSAAF